MLGFAGGSVVKDSPANAGDAGSIPGPGRPPGKENGNPPQYTCLGNPTDGGAWWATKSQTVSPWGHKETQPWDLNNK